MLIISLEIMIMKTIDEREMQKRTKEKQTNTERSKGNRSYRFLMNRMQNSISNELKSCLVSKFTCASCSCSYIGETCRHFKARVEEHIKKDNVIFLNIYTPPQHGLTHNFLCFKMIDKANSKFDLKIKKLYILTGENLILMHNKII